MPDPHGYPRRIDLPESTFQLAFEASTNGMAFVDEGGRCVAANPALCRLLGYSRRELLQLRLADLLHPNDLGCGEEQWRAAVAGVPDRCSVQKRYRRKDGHWVWGQVSVSPMFPWGRGRLLFYLIQDVSGRREAEQATAASERRFRRLADSALQGMVVLRVEEHCAPLFVNDAAALMFGFSFAAEAVALPSFTEVLPEALRRQIAANWEHLRSGEAPSFRARVCLSAEAGEPRWLEALGARVEWAGAPALQLALLDVTEQQRLQRELERLATTDSLTGLLNRREFMSRGSAEVRRARRRGYPLALLMIDVDHFKRINDSHGHACGDRVLQRLATAMGRALRENDLLARLGGEEFAALLVHADQPQAEDAAERLRAACASAHQEPRGERLPAATASIGVSHVAAGEAGLDAALSRADAALYRAKAEGRNRVRCGD